MFAGGANYSPWYRDEDGDENIKYSDVSIWGTLIADPKVEMFNKKKTSFTIKYHRKTFVNVVIWGDSNIAGIASRLQKGDTVLCAGVLTVQKYIAKKGQYAGTEREWYELTPMILFSQENHAFTVGAQCSEPLIRMIEEGEQQKASDIFESANDHDDDYELTI